MLTRRLSNPASTPYLSPSRMRRIWFTWLPANVHQHATSSWMAMAEGIEALVADIASHPLNRFHLVQDDQQTRVATITEHSQQPLEEAQRPEVVDVTLHLREPLRRRRDIGLAGQPRHDAVRNRRVVGQLGLSIPAQGSAEHWGGLRHSGEALLQQRRGPIQQPALITGPHLSLCQNVLFQRVEPAIKYVAQGPLRRVGGCQLLNESTVHRFDTVQRCLRLRDLHFRGGESHALRAFLQPSREERLAASVLPADGLEPGGSRLGGLQFRVERCLEAIEPHSERIQTPAGNRTPAEGIDDLLTSLRTYLHVRLPLSQLELLPQHLDVQLHGVTGIVLRQDRVALNV